MITAVMESAMPVLLLSFVNHLVGIMVNLFSILVHDDHLANSWSGRACALYLPVMVWVAGYDPTASESQAQRSAN